jgi:pimeloyl-ACP methyl ester carboxylesterase
VNLIILPGNNWHNQEWTEEVERMVSDDFEKTWMQKYDSWMSHEAVLDLDKESRKLIDKGQEFGQYCVFAKSAGALLCMKVVKEGRFHPSKCMFVGASIKWGLEQGWPVNDWVKDFNVPTLFLHKKDDPIMGFEELRIALEKGNVTNCKLIEIPGNSHHYERVFELKRMLKVWVSE